jgi:hypothetical protein
MIHSRAGFSHPNESLSCHEFFLGNNTIASIPSEIGVMTNLEKLDLSKCSRMGLSLSRCVSMKILKAAKLGFLFWI